MNKIIQTNDGSNSLFSEKFGEQYHSIHGALQESMHVFIEAGLDHCKKKSIKILEIGFGTGLNAILSFQESLARNLTIEYTAIELYPVDLRDIQQLNYFEFLNIESKKAFTYLHQYNWNKNMKLSNHFSIHKIDADFNTYIFKDQYDLIYFDAFAPEVQPEMWSKENFEKLYHTLNKDGILTTYSSKGLVKNNLREAGFLVKRLPGPKGKRHILRATKN